MLTRSDEGKSAAAAINSTLATLDPTPRTADVVGESALATAARQLLDARGVRIDSCGSDRSVDLLVDVTGDPASWEKRLEVLRDEGTVLLIVPAGAVEC